jgi:hypothetical protein
MECCGTKLLSHWELVALIQSCGMTQHFKLYESEIQHSQMIIDPLQVGRSFQTVTGTKAGDAKIQIGLFEVVRTKSDS